MEEIKTPTLNRMEELKEKFMLQRRLVIHV